MRSFGILIGIGLLSLNLLQPRAACADGHPYTLSLGFQTPIGMSPQKRSEDSPSYFWNAKITVIEKVRFFTNGLLNFKKGTPWDAENKMQFGLERPIGYNLSLFGAYERRPDLDTNRYLVGVRWDFGGKL